MRTTQTTKTLLAETASFHDQLASIEAKLDYVVERQRFFEELIDDMMPVGRDALATAAQTLQALEDRGVFEFGTALLGAADRVVSAYSPEDVRLLSDNLVGILDTVRNVTQPDILALANDATNLVHNGEDVAPVGLFGAMRATRDDDVRRGMAVALAILQKLGQATREHPSTPPRRPTGPAVATATPAPAARRVAAPAPVEPAQASVPAEPAKAEGEFVEWEGHRFRADGFLADPNTWDEALAAKIAAGFGIPLGDEHWKVIRWARQDWQSTGASPNVRRVASGSGVGTAAMYDLFPKTPGKTCAIVAGIPKPVGCV